MMRLRFKIIISASLLATALSCNKFEEKVDGVGETILITVDDISERTRVTLNNHTPVWTAEDSIKVFDTSGDAAVYRFISESSGIATFVCTRKETNFSMEDFAAAYYPAAQASSYDNTTKKIRVTVPQTQQYAENTFANGSAPMVSDTLKTSNGKRLIHFSNAFGVVRIPLYNNAATTVTKISMESQDVVYKLSGTFDLTISSSNSVTATPVSGNSKVELTCSKNLGTSSGAPTYFYIPVPAPDNSTKPVVKVSVTFNKNGISGYVDTYELIVNYSDDLNQIIQNNITGLDATKVLLDTTDYSLSVSPKFRLFKNTTSSSTTDFTVSVKAKVSGKDVTLGDWYIDSYRLGKNGADHPVTGDAFSDSELEVTRSENKINVKASARTVSFDPSTHEYWVGANGAWSPVDWSGTRATQASPLDLSKFDFQAETSTGTMSTANCYIIRHAGTYMIPLVYGNGIKNGSVNTESFNPSVRGSYGGQSASTTYYFKDYLNNSISSPFIENNYTAARASVVWQYETDLISDLAIVGASKTLPCTFTTSDVRYLRFTVNQNKIRQGNALIAIEDSDGKIIWSWHIWTTNDPALLEEPIKTENNYYIFPIETVGWIDTDRYETSANPDVYVTVRCKENPSLTDTVRIFKPALRTNTNYDAVLYQWGRKDPFPGNLDNVHQRKDTIKFNSSRAVYSLAESITSPATMFREQVENTSKGEINWFSGQDRKFLWRADPTDVTLNKKTIYDPSPVGYQVPPSSAYAKLKLPREGTAISSNPDISNKEYNYGMWLLAENSKLLFMVGLHSYQPDNRFGTGWARVLPLSGNYVNLWYSQGEYDSYGYSAALFLIGYYSYNNYYAKYFVGYPNSYAIAVRPVKEGL